MVLGVTQSRVQERGVVASLVAQAVVAHEDRVAQYAHAAGIVVAACHRVAKAQLVRAVACSGKGLLGLSEDVEVDEGPISQLIARRLGVEHRFAEAHIKGDDVSSLVGFVIPRAAADDDAAGHDGGRLGVDREGDGVVAVSSVAVAVASEIEHGATADAQRDGGARSLACCRSEVDGVFFGVCGIRGQVGDRAGTARDHDVAGGQAGDFFAKA